MIDYIVFIKNLYFIRIKKFEKGLLMIPLYNWWQINFLTSVQLQKHPQLIPNFYVKVDKWDKVRLNSFSTRILNIYFKCFYRPDMFENNTELGLIRISKRTLWYSCCNNCRETNRILIVLSKTLEHCPLSCRCHYVDRYFLVCALVRQFITKQNINEDVKYN